MKFIYFALPLMATSAIIYVEMNSEKPWWLIPFAVAQILILVARDMEDKTNEKIKELEHKVEELSKAVEENT